MSMHALIKSNKNFCSGFIKSLYVSTHPGDPILFVFIWFSDNFKKQSEIGLF